MIISLDLFLEALDGYRYDRHVPREESPAFTRLCLLPEDTLELRQDRIYVGVLSDALSMRARGAHFYSVCVRDRFQDDAETPELLDGLIVVNENVTAGSVFSRLQDLYFSVSEWVERMNRFAYEKKPVQDILELSEPIIGNFISVSDSALRLIAYTSHIPVDDPICVRLLENGFHPEETIEEFRRTGQFEVWDRSDGEIVNTDRELSAYDICSKVFKFHNTYYVHVVMTCNNRPLTKGVRELFGMLTDVLDFYVEQNWKQHSYSRHIYDSLIIDLIEGTVSDPAEIDERAALAGMAPREAYRLLLIGLETADKTPVGRIGLELSEIFGEYTVTAYQNRIVLLAGISGDNEPEFYSKMRGYLKEYRAECGVSARFGSLSAARLAYRQAELALKYAPCVRNGPVQSGGESDHVVEYDRHFLLITVGESPESEAMWRTTKYYSMLRTLDSYDEKRGTDNIKLLYTFLLCGCRAPEASKLLHMHRNNVLYRINRIEQLMGAELTDEEVRRGLLNSYPMLQLYGL